MIRKYGASQEERRVDIIDRAERRATGELPPRRRGITQTPTYQTLSNIIRGVSSDAHLLVKFIFSTGFPVMYRGLLQIVRQSASTFRSLMQNFTNTLYDQIMIPNSWMRYLLRGISGTTVHLSMETLKLMWELMLGPVHASG